MLFEIKFTIDNYTKIPFFLCICQFVVCIPLLQLIEILCIIRFAQVHHLAFFGVKFQKPGRLPRDWFLDNQCALRGEGKHSIE